MCLKNEEFRIYKFEISCSESCLKDESKLTALYSGILPECAFIIVSNLLETTNLSVVSQPKGIKIPLYTLDYIVEHYKLGNMILNGL